MPESQQKKLSRVRKPRVHITYDVEIGDAEVERELPFIVGVMGDFTGTPSKKLAQLKDRKFITIDRDNFNDVMAQLGPEVTLRVDNTMQDDGKEIAVNLKFESMDDFAPARVAEQVPQLKQLVDTRDKLRDLLTKVDRSPDLESILEETLTDTSKIAKLAEELGTDGGGSDES